MHINITIIDFNYFILPTNTSSPIIQLVASGYIHHQYDGLIACRTNFSPNVMKGILAHDHLRVILLMLLLKGEMRVNCGRKEMMLKKDDLLLLPPHARITDLDITNDSMGTCLVALPSFFEEITTPQESHFSFDSTSLHPFVYSLEEVTAITLSGVCSQIENAILIPHIYKKEIIRSLLYVCKTLIAETRNVDTGEPFDYSHKENVFKIFLHLAANNFRQHRQIDYYADRLCITNTYLSRIVREVSGKTVNNYLTQMVYDEACRLLTTTDKPLGEIAFDLNFANFGSNCVHLIIREIFNAE